MQIIQSRRNFLAGLSAAGAAGILGPTRSLADEGPLETTTLRLQRGATIYLAPGQIAEELLRAEGFTDIRYMDVETVAGGEIDFAFQTAAWVVSRLDAGEPLTALAGVHSGCYELFAHEPIRAISDLKGEKSASPRNSAPAGTCSSRALPRMSGSTITRTSTGSAIPPGISSSRSPRARSMPFSASPPNRRNCVRARSVA